MNEEEIVQKIVAYSDGELNSEESAELFDHIAMNPEYQEELSYHLKMKNVYSKMIETPPPILKSKILASSGIGFVFWKTKSFIYSSVASGLAVATTIGYFLGISNAPIEENNFAVNNNNKVLNEMALPDVKTDYINELKENNFAEENPQINNSNIFENDFSEKGNIINNDNLAKNNISLINEEKNIDNNFYSVPNLNESEILPSNNLILNTSLNEGRVFIVSSNISQSDIENINSFMSKLNFTFRGTMANNLTEVDILNSNKLDFNNASIALFYEYSDKLHFGLEFSGEDYAQKYSKQVANVKTTYHQYYNTNYFGLTGKYYFADNLLKIDDLSLFGKGLIGGTQLGPIVRAEIGAEYNLFQNWNIYLAYEGSNLTYFFEDKLHNSSRSGLNFGFKYDF